MAIIDSQVHSYEANTSKRPWHSVPNWPDHVTGDEMVAAMDRVGVDGAIFISAFSMYRYDASYAVEVQRAHPGRFALVKPVDPDDPAVADVIADWKKRLGASRTTRGSTGSCAPRFGTTFRSTCCAGATWTRARRSSTATPTRDSSSTIWPSCSPERRPPRRSHGPICRRCWTSPSAGTR